jgi:aminopeptidase N
VTTAEGRDVTLAIWAAPGDIPRCHYALGALERSLRWDEQRFGRCYDLDVYNLVAAQDFTMGAMENKGLNIFNARYVLADPDTATDADFIATEAVIGHEYFHNWSGNRVTLRDWFQLSLKEGFTVFRDQEFTSDLHSRPVKRIEDVRLLRARQFSEDAGALAHPVRPDSYREINNFYTATVYEKGSEVVRMLHTLLGEETFRRGCDRYFAENDGRAATVEDFLSAMAAESGRGLEQFAVWYRQAGTPEVRIEDKWDASSGVYEMTVTQQTPPSPGQSEKLPVTIPLRFCLYGANGEAMTRAPQGGPSAAEDPGATEGTWLIELTAAEHRLRFEGLPAKPLPAFNQGFAAPIKLRYGYTPADLGRLARTERDPFNRWEALQRLATGIMLHQFPDEAAAQNALAEAVSNLLRDEEADAAFVAECLNLPDFDTLADMAPVIDVAALLTARNGLLDFLARALGDDLEGRYVALAKAAAGGLEGAAMAARSLRNACLDWMTRAQPANSHAAAQYTEAANLTERLGALRCMVRYDAPAKAAMLAEFQNRYRDNDLVTDKWLALVAARPHPDALTDVRALLQSEWWRPTNPNRVRAIVGAFARQNPAAFHRADGAGYALLAEVLPVLDKINSQVASRQLGALESWARLAGERRTLAEKALQGLRGKLTSRDCADLLARLLP